MNKLLIVFLISCILILIVYEYIKINDYNKINNKKIDNKKIDDKFYPISIYPKLENIYFYKDNIHKELRNLLNDYKFYIKYI